MSSLPSPAKLRQLIFKFYSENDPAKLQMGLDINGIVEWTMRNGIDALNEMLMKQFGKKINLEENTGTAKDQLRLSVGLSMSTQIAKKEHEYRMKLHGYFTEHDKSMLDASKDAQFEKFVKFAMLNGWDKLNEKLEKKYGVGVGNDKNANQVNNAKTNVDSEPDIPMVELGAFGENPFRLDVDRLKDDLAFFYEEMEDEEQLEVLDEIADWACQIGIAEFDDKIEQMYGQSLNEFLQENGRKPHKDNLDPKAAKPNNKPSMQIQSPVSAPPKVQAQTPVPAKVAEPPMPARQVSLEESEDEASQPGADEFEGEAREFEGMTDDELKAELSLFYQKYDEDNLEKLDQVCDLARKLGRDDLNGKLKEIYGDILTPIPVHKPKPKAAKPKPAAVSKVALGNGMNRPPGLGFDTGLSGRYTPANVAMAAAAEAIERQQADMDMESAPPPIPPRASVQPAKVAEQDDNDETASFMGMESIKMKPDAGASAFPYSTEPVVNDDEEEQDEPETAPPPEPARVSAPEPEPVVQQEAPKVPQAKGSVEDILASERDAWRHQIKPNEKETEFQRMAREKRERNLEGKSRVRGENGEIIEINILLAACNRYRLDVFSGICECGFSKADHAKQSKYKVNKNLENVKELRNSRGLMKVKDFAKNLSKNAKKVEKPASKVQTKQVKHVLASKRWGNK